MRATGKRLMCCQFEWTSAPLDASYIENCNTITGSYALFPLEKCRVAAAATLGTGNVCVVEWCYGQCSRDADSVANTSATSVQRRWHGNGTVTYVIRPLVLNLGPIFGRAQEVVQAHAVRAVAHWMDLMNILHLCTDSRMKLRAGLRGHTDPRSTGLVNGHHLRP